MGENKKKIAMGENKKKIAVVVPRYGTEVTGGVPDYARELLQKLKDFYIIDVLTTTASDYETWANHFSEGEHEEDGITIHRFKTTVTRDMTEYEKLDVMRSRLGIFGGTLDQKRIYAQGPVSRGLIAYIKDHKDDYDRFVFITFQYFPTVYGLPQVADKSVLIPLAREDRDAEHLNYKIYKELFKSAKSIIFMSDKEQQAVGRIIKQETKSQTVAALGIDVPDYLNEPMQRLQAVDEFRNKYGIEGEYIIYTGRISKRFGCEGMFDIYKKYRGDSMDKPLHLLAIGKADNDMALPRNIGAYYPGFLTERERLVALAGARFQWIPADCDMNPRVCLTGMAMSVPVLTRELCPAVSEQVKRSEAGYIYDTDEQCIKYLNVIGELTDEDYAKLRVKAKFYAGDHYGWDAILKKVTSVIG